MEKVIARRLEGCVAGASGRRETSGTTKGMRLQAGGVRAKTVGVALFSVALLLVGVSITVIQYKVPSILESVMGAFGMSASAGSWLMSVFTMVGIFLALPAGSLARRFGPARVLLLGSGIVIAGSVLGALASSTPAMIVSRGIEGVAFVLVTVAGPLAIERYVPKDRRGTANGVWSLWICLGSFAGLTATPAIYGALGLSGTWLAFAVFAAFAAIAFALAVRGRSGEAPDGGGSLERSDDGKATLRDHLSLLRPNALLYFFGYFVFNIEILAVLGYTPTFLQSAGMDASLSGFASSLPGLLAIVSAIVFGRLVDLTGKTKALYFVAALAAGPATFLMLTQAGPLLWVGAALMGLVGYGLPVACLSSVLRIAGSARLVPAAIGLLMLAQSLGEFFGSLVTPLLLGPSMSNWLLCGTVIGVLGLASAGAVALCRFR